MQGVYVKKVSVLPRPITPTFFSDRMASLDHATSAAIYHALQGAHMLDLQDMLVQDPRQAAALTIAGVLVLLQPCSCRMRRCLGDH